MARKPKEPPRMTLDTLMGIEPPHSIEAEMALLGACILDPRVIDEVFPILPPADAFYSEAHAIIWGALLTTRGDLLMLHQRLRDVGSLKDIGGGEYLQKLASETPGAATAPHYAKVLAEKAKRRRIIHAAQAALNAAYTDADQTADQVCDKAVGAMLDAGKNAGSVRDVTLGEAMDQVVTDIGKGVPMLWKTNLRSFDAQFDGIMQGSVTTVFGAPNTGKTTLAMQFVQMLALCGVNVRVFSREQGPKRIAATIMQQLATNSPIPVHEMLNRGTKPTAEEWVQIKNVRKDADIMDFAIVSDRLDAQQIYQRCLLYKRQGVQLVVIDYLQNLPPIPGIDYGTAQIDTACQWVQSIAVDLGIAVIAVSQITAEASRAAADRKEPKCPSLSDCRGGNSIEAISDMAFAVWRPHLNARMEAADSWASERKDRNQTAVECAKGKYSGRGGIELRFNPRTMTFEDLDGQGYLAPKRQKRAPDDLPV